MRYYTLTLFTVLADNIDVNTSLIKNVECVLEIQSIEWKYFKALIIIVRPRLKQLIDLTQRS